jgi:redox-sensitive bicupin YhaK (pirin superfamily)
MSTLAPEGAGILVVEPVSRDLGGFSVRRILPSAKRRTVGPFVFLDHMGPTIMRAGEGMDVRPHPHIGLATLTYLVEGRIRHRDTLGSVQDIEPGAVNWMTAGRGIAHSERTNDADRLAAHAAHGMQSWIALPAAHEETDPGFAHHDAAGLPRAEDRGMGIRLIAGSAFGMTSPVVTFSETLQADLRLAIGARLALPREHPERALYILDGGVVIAGQEYGPHRMLVFRPGDEIVIEANAPTRALLLGGEPLDGPRHLWWNFVSSSRERIEQAKADWQAGRFGTIPGETEFIPLPDR